jgi:O-antigen/teichoic acid export membrane protein
MTFIQKSVTFLMLPIYTIYLSPEEYGAINMVITIGNIFILLFTYALDETAARYYFQYNHDKKRQKVILGTIVIISLIFVLLGSIFIFLVREYIYTKFIPGITIDLIILSILVIATSPIYSIYQKLQRIKDNAIMYSVISFSYSVCQIILIVLFIIYLKLSVRGYLLAMAITSCFFFFFCLFSLRKEFVFSIDIDHIQGLLKYASSIVPHTLSSWGLNGFSNLLIGNILGAAYLGIYSAMSFGGTILFVMSTAFFNAWQPWLYKKLETIDNQNKDLINSLVKIILLIFTLFAFVLSLFSAEISHIFINERYTSDTVIAFFIIFNNLMLCIGSCFVFFLYYKKDYTKYIAFSTFVGVAVNIVLSFLLIPHFKLIGASMALGLSFFVISFIRQIYVSKYLEMKMYSIDIYLLSLINLVISYFSITGDISMLFKILIILFEILFLILFYRKRIMIILLLTKIEG